MVTCALGIARNVLLEVRRPDGAPQRSSIPPVGTPETDVDVPSRYGLVALGIALFLAYPVALQYMGFLVATFLLMTLFMWVGQWRSPLGILVTGATGTLVLFYVFRGVVYVSLPLGVGPFEDFTVLVAHLLNMR